MLSRLWSANGTFPLANALCRAAQGEQEEPRPILNPKEVPRQRLPQATVCHSTSGGQGMCLIGCSPWQLASRRTIVAEQNRLDMAVSEGALARRRAKHQDIQAFLFEFSTGDTFR